MTEKVALKRFVDDISVMAIEHTLIRKLPSLSEPEWVHGLSDDDIAQLVAETGDTTAERARGNEKISVLETGLHDVKRLDEHRSTILSKSRCLLPLLFATYRIK
jgi:hypothetical protein